MTNCAGADGVSPSAEETAEAECSVGAGSCCSRLLANKLQFRRENTTKRDRRREKFTAGFLSEPARPHFTWNRGRQGDVFHSRNRKSPDRGWVRPEPNSRLRCRQKYSFSGEYPSCFFIFSEAGDSHSRNRTGLEWLPQAPLVIWMRPLHALRLTVYNLSHVTNVEPPDAS